MKLGLRAAALGGLLAAPPLVCMATSLDSQDATFALKAAQAGLTEVQLASLAMKKSTNASVLSFAREMSADHTKANAQLVLIVKAKGMTPPTSVGAENAAVITKLRAQTGKAFDASYLQSQLPAHQQVLALFKSEAADGKDGELVAFAKSTIPVIESHIAMDRRDIKMASANMQMSASK